MKKYFVTFFVALISLFQTLPSFQLNRVILATNDNPTYIQFWPVVAPVWQAMGLRPTLILVANEDCKVDETLGDVVRFPPLADVPESLQTQVLRLLLPALYPEDVCITSDIDMLPVSYSYFHDYAANVTDKEFLVYRDGYAYFDPVWKMNSYPMCYNAAKGKVFGDVFGVSKIEDFPAVVREWASRGYGWSTDEKILFQYVTNWEAKGNHIVRLGHTTMGRLDRANWIKDGKVPDLKRYIDCHCPRPYSDYKTTIDQVVEAINNDIKKQNVAPIPEVYSKIKDIYHPTNEDYKLIQEYLSKGEREGVQNIKDPNYTYLAKTFKIIGDKPTEIPTAGTIAVNTDAKERENCVILYSSFNRSYPKGLIRLVDLIKKSDYKGHIMYRLGGWPNTETGMLLLAHVPYAFKVSFFLEAKRLGYKKVLWLDTSILPVVSLNKIFEMIGEKGYLAIGNSHMVGPYMNEKAAAAFGLTLKDTYNIPSCAATVFGVDFTNPKGARIIDIFYRAAKDKDAYYSGRQEQNALSVILYKEGVRDLIPIERMPEKGIDDAGKTDILFLIDRLYVHKSK